MNPGKFALVMTSLMVSACSAVFSPVPVGEHPVKLVAEEWDGTWLGDQGLAVIEVRDEQDGILEIGFVENMDMEAFEVHVRQSGDWTFGSFIDMDDDPGEAMENDHGQRFLWGRIAKRDARIIIWAPDVAKVRALVRSGILPGSVGEREGFSAGDVLLGELTPEHYEIITGSAHGVLLEWEDPQVLFRYSR